MLDAGAGYGPYREHFQHVSYESADFCQVDKTYAAVTYQCELDAIPVENERYDLVLCTQVLEHLPDPLRVLGEMNRVLKPGGRIWLSAPFYYEEHEQPYDFFRYTQFALTDLLKKAGFEIERLEWLEGYFGTLSYQLDQAVASLPSLPGDYGGGLKGWLTSALVLVLRPGLSLLSRLLSRADLRVRWTRTGHCKNYCVVARKAIPVQAGGRLAS